MNTTAARPRRPPALLLMGPTASGKSALAMAIAREIPVEIVSVDSAQVFRGMDVGTAKPPVADRRAVAHHLIDIIDPTEAYSAAKFRSDALKLIDQITARGNVPLLAGGTMLYFKALREGLSDLPQADSALRAMLEQEATRHGWPRMHARLAELDPPTAARLHPTDAQRIQRALEVHHLTGRRLSDLQGARKPGVQAFEAVEIALIPSDRGMLHQRIAARFDAMLAGGLVAELRSLQQRWPLHPQLPSMRCVGYRQAWEHLAGAYDLPTLRDRGIFATRQLAKRQLTWLRAMPGAEVFDCLAPDLESRVLACVRTALG